MSKRSAFTLLELILALSLVVVATALIGNLMHLYSRNFATRGEDIRRMQLARSVLNMIAEDLRAVVIKQPYDASVLQQQLGAGGGEGSPTGGASSGATTGPSSGPQSAAVGGSNSASQPVQPQLVQPQLVQPQLVQPRRVEQQPMRALRRPQNLGFMEPSTN